MAEEVLSQDEIDTLLNGVEDGDVTTEGDQNIDGNEAVSYELGSQDRIIRGRMPTLDMINERFIRYLRISMFNMLRRSVEVNVVGVNMIKFSEYVRGLFMPTSLNLVGIEPLRGTGLFVIDPNLVFATVDNFFGGDGRYHTRIEGREFTPTENRVVQLLLDLLFNDLERSWKPVLELHFNYLNSEINPQFANIVSPTEVVVVTKFKLELEGGGGEFHVVMPYSMLEPIRELLDTGMQSDQIDVDHRWTNSLKDELKQAPVEIDCAMSHIKLTLAEVLDLNEGDIIPIDMPDVVTVRAAKTPIFRGMLGNSNGKNSVQFVSPIIRPDYSKEVQ
ncbi:Flagellar motor switch protein FliM [hydrothermal vent metagenome]|uniref:Flagellar motor switch protein FliM n=1 Tax=hydrothermal vent metagenome TaxID=652676 RepID=A0A3B0WLE6_9ZZZZ